nr:hypothetical protein [Tanacetum cinerariifolium]
SDSDYGGATEDHKSTTRGCQFLGRRLISWQCKKQTIVATSTTKAEYIPAASGCGQVLWIQNQLLDYGHHFIRDCFEKKLISMDHIHTDENVADLLTKHFDAGRFQYLVVEHAMCGFLKGNLIIYTTFVSHTVYGWGIGTSKYLGVLRILMIRLRLIPLFWSTARIETTKEGTNILATVDGKLRTVFESSIRSLKLNDEAGVSSLPNAELFENLTLMGYNISPNKKFTFQKGQFSPTNWVFNFSKMIFDGMVRNVNNKGEGLGTPTEPHHTPTSKASQSLQHKLPSPSLLPVLTKSLPTVIPFNNPPLRQYTRRAKIAQSSTLLPIADEPASPIRDDSEGEACPTDYGLKVDQARATIPKTSTLPSDSTPRVTSLAADEGSMKQKLDELTALCTSLQRQQSEMISKFAAQELEINMLKAKIKLLEDKDKRVAEQSRDDAHLRGGVVPTATISIPTGSGVVSTASPTIPTASPIFTTATESTPYTRRKGKETMVESETPKKKKVQEQIDVQLARELEEEMARDAQRMNEQIARDAEIARIHEEEELQMLIDGLDRNNETTQQRKPLSRKQQKEFYMSVLKSHVEEVKRFKRKGVRLEQDSSKKLKTLEEVPKEKLKEMMELIPVEEVYVEALQVKHPIINWEVHTEGEISYWKIIRLGDVEDQLWTHTQNLMHALVEWKLYDMCGIHHVTSKDKEISMFMEKDYPLRKGLAILMISYKLQVENYS